MNIDLAEMVLWYICLLFSLSVHEASHAGMAYLKGDDTARLQGRLTLNPLAHIDPVGTVIMPILMMVTHIPYLIGWAKPVPVNHLNLRHVRKDPVWVSLAGPASNLAIVIVALIIMKIAQFAMVAMGSSPAFVVYVLSVLVALNLILFLFNLLPIPPLDGHHVLHYFLPPRGQEMLEQIGPFGILIIIFLARPLMRIPANFLFGLVDWFTQLGVRS